MQNPMASVCERKRKYGQIYVGMDDEGVTDYRIINNIMKLLTTKTVEEVALFLEVTTDFLKKYIENDANKTEVTTKQLRIRKIFSLLKTKKARVESSEAAQAAQAAESVSVNKETSIEAFCSPLPHVKYFGSPWSIVLEKIYPRPSQHEIEDEEFQKECLARSAVKLKGANKNVKNKKALEDKSKTPKAKKTKLKKTKNTEARLENSQSNLMKLCTRKHELIGAHVTCIAGPYEGNKGQVIDTCGVWMVVRVGQVEKEGNIKDYVFHANRSYLRVDMSASEIVPPSQCDHNRLKIEGKKLQPILHGQSVKVIKEGPYKNKFGIVIDHKGHKKKVSVNGDVISLSKYWLMPVVSPICN